MLAVLALAAVLGPGSLQPRPALEARFIGNMSYAITDGTTTLMTDFPYQSGYSRYMTYDPAQIRSAEEATLSLITHRHLDHWEPALFGATGWKVAGPADAVGRAGRRIDAKQVVIYHQEQGQRVPECGEGCSVPRQGDVLRF